VRRSLKGKGQHKGRAQVATKLGAPELPPHFQPLPTSGQQLPLLSAILKSGDNDCGGSDWSDAFDGLGPLLDYLVTVNACNPDGLGLIEDDNPRAIPRAPTLTQHAAKCVAGRTVVRVYAT
jgi:hypothetical protein